MAHARLAIIGTENGAQPIHHGESLLVVNGEISNHAELRAALGARAFQTASDSETILHLSRTGRSRWITELNGMFAFVLATPDRIIAGRDHLGIKPLYVTTIVSQPRTLPGAWPMSSATRADVRPTLSRLWRMRTPRSRSDTTQRFHRVRPCTR
jgi:glutamine phosphoribosylpyrophosphate amidotransferase